RKVSPLRAQRFALRGRNPDPGEARVQGIRDGGYFAAYFGAGARSSISLKEAHAAVSSALGSPTILVNAAGGNDPRVTVTAENPFQAIALEHWRAHFALNPL